MHKKFFWPWLLLFLTSSAFAQFRPPAFMGGIPGAAQMQSLSVQRHQARTLLYLEAIEELKKNPKAADVPECPANSSKSVDGLCLRQPAATTPTPPPSTAKEAPAPEGRRIALLVGNNSYRSPIPVLETPIADVEAVANTLKRRFGFETRVMRNATKEQIIREFNQLAEESKPADRILLFYAGHGYEMDNTKMGYWIPVDGSNKTAANWISNTDISKLLSAIKAGQLILVSDSCFSGTLTKEQKVEYFAIEQTPAILTRRSVLAFSSGDEEPVSDEGKGGHSIFAWNLLKALDSIQGVTPGYHVYRLVHKEVTKDAEQTPQYGAVVSAGHMSGGEYLFSTLDSPVPNR